jgi:hypothetical protein
MPSPASEGLRTERNRVSPWSRRGNDTVRSMFIAASPRVNHQHLLGEAVLGHAPRGRHGGRRKRQDGPATLPTSARIAALIGSGSVGQRSRIKAKSGSVGDLRAKVWAKSPDGVAVSICVGWWFGKTFDGFDYPYKTGPV